MSLHAGVVFTYLSALSGNHHIIGDRRFQIVKLACSLLWRYMLREIVCAWKQIVYLSTVLSEWKWALWTQVVFNLSYFSSIIRTLVLWLCYSHKIHCPTTLEVLFVWVSVSNRLSSTHSFWLLWHKQVATYTYTCVLIQRFNFYLMHRCSTITSILIHIEVSCLCWFATPGCLDWNLNLSFLWIVIFVMFSRTRKLGPYWLVTSQWGILCLCQ